MTLTPRAKKTSKKKQGGLLNFSEKQNIQTMKRQLVELRNLWNGRQIFANRIPNDRLLTKIHKELIEPNSKERKKKERKKEREREREREREKERKKEIQLKNGQNTRIDIFLKKRYTIANWYKKRCSTSLILGKMQIKTIMRHHIMPVRMSTF